MAEVDVLPADEPMFDPSLKKKRTKKKTVVFNEEPEGPAPVPEPSASPVPHTPGPSILKTKPSSESVKVSANVDSEVTGLTKEDPVGAVGGDDFGFGELKKKKKKKEIPLDLVSIDILRP